MTVQDLTQLLISALDLPDSCRVNQRIPKKMLIEHGAPTGTDRRLINSIIEEIQWLAALKPNTVGVAEYRDSEREYLEIAILCVITRGAEMEEGVVVAPAGIKSRPVNIARLAELVHRAIPYPVVLVLETSYGLFLSLAHKRWAQNEADKVVLDEDGMAVDQVFGLADNHPFLRTLALAQQPQSNLLTLYQGWMDCLTAWQAAQYTGTFVFAATPAQAIARREALRTCRRLEQDGARLRAMAAKEKQMAKLVELNLALKRLGIELDSAREQL